MADAFTVQDLSPYPTYEELKPGGITSLATFSTSPYPTYEELKLALILALVKGAVR